MIAVKGNNKRGASVAFIENLIDDALAPIELAIAPTSTYTCAGLTVTGNTLLNGSLTQTVGGVNKFSVDTSGNTLVAGTVGVTGNTTFNGTLTQTVGGVNKFSVDASGNTLIAGTLGVTGNETDSGTVSATGLLLTGTTGSLITLPATYSSPPGAGSLGQQISVVNTSQVSMPNSTYTTLATLSIPIGVWMLYGKIGFQTAGTVSFFQGGLSTSSSSFDDWNYVEQFIQNATSGNNIMVGAIPRYVCNSAAVTYYMVAVSAGAASTGNQSAYTYSTIRAVRIA